MNITELIENYNKTESIEIFDKIEKILDPIISQKARFIYYRQPFKSERIKGKKHVPFYFTLNKTNSLDYEDVKQEIWLMVYKLIKNFNGSNDFMTYLFTSLWKWKPTINLKGMTGLEYIQIDENTENIADDNINDLDTEYILNLLNPIEKEVVYYFYSNKYNQSEIANILKISKGRISQILTRIKKKIKNLT